MTNWREVLGRFATLPVRRARDEDFDAILPLLAGFAAEMLGEEANLEGVARDLMSHFVNPLRALWVLEVDGEIVGIIGADALIPAAWERDKDVLIGRFYVDPPHRGARAAASLLLVALEDCIASGATRFYGYPARGGWPLCDRLFESRVVYELQVM